VAIGKFRAKHFFNDVNKIGGISPQNGRIFDSVRHQLPIFIGISTSCLFVERPLRQILFTGGQLNSQTREASGGENFGNFKRHKT
jgi:hypothetical protein